MLRTSTVIFVCLCMAGMAVAQTKSLPQFKDYPAQEKFSGKPAQPKLASKRARLFRTMIRTQAAEGPNFAGHYRIATWGCGAGCVQFAIVDVKTGDVYFPPEVETVMVLLEQEGDPLQFQAEGRLLVITGQKEKANFRNAGEGRFFYEWRNNRLVLLRSVKLERKLEQSVFAAGARAPLPARRAWLPVNAGKDARAPAGDAGSTIELHLQSNQL